MRKLLSLMLALSLVLGGVTFLSPQSVEASGFKFSKEHEEALQYLNEIRRAVGVGDLVLDPYLNEAAQNHANYLNMHNTTGHSEDPKKEGFTGRSASERVEAVGYDKVSLSEVTVSGTRELKEAVDDFMETVHHRLPLIDYGNKKVGFGVSGNKVVVIFDREAGPWAEPMTYYYPYDGQTNVYTSFLGRTENPNPLTRFGIDRSGTVISYHPVGRGYELTTKLVDSKGTDVPHFTSSEGWIFLYPKSPLKEGETYTVTVKYGDRTDTWSFTTRGTSSGGNEPTKPDNGSIDPSIGKQFVDFEEGKYWSENMLWAISNGLIAGYESKDPKTGKIVKTIQPRTALSEAQFLTILFRYNEPDLLKASSPQDENWWASQSYVVADKLNLPTKGSHNNRKAANDPMTRGEMAVVLGSYFNMKYNNGRALNEYDSIELMYAMGLSNGYPDKYGNTPKTYESYGANDILLREHIVTFMRNYDNYLNE